MKVRRNNWFWAVASIVALAIPSTAAASTQTQESETWYCYSRADVQGYKGVVISAVFEWYGEGAPPQNVMSNQFREYSQDLMPAALWPSTSCFRERARADGERMRTINIHNQSGGAVVEQYYAYEEE